MIRGSKTFTVVQLLQELYIREERLLVTASTHQAVDNVLRKWVKEFPIADADDPHGTIIRLGDIDSVDEDCRCWTVDMHPSMKDVRNVYQASRMQKKLISKCQVIFSTATGAGLGMLRQHGIDFDTVLVDEAGQLSSANTRVASCKAQRRVVLIGDHKQLRATVHENSKKLYFEESLFEKLHRSNCPCVMLDTQYRMHPSLIQFSSEQFYDGKICSAESVKELQPFTCFPFSGKHHAVWVDVVKGREKRVGTSFSNEEEAKLIFQYVLNLIQKEECEAKDIGVITGYSAQVSCIKDYLERNTATKSSVKVSTVDGFQGQERQVILFSATRTGHHIGFLRDRQRMNVMLTRAKRGLVVLGRMDTLRIDPVWKEWISKTSPAIGGQDN